MPLSLSSYRLLTSSEPKLQRKVFTSPGAALISRISFSLNRSKSKKLPFLGGRGQGLPWRESVRIYRNVSNQLYMIFSACKYQCRVWARGEGEYNAISTSYSPPLYPLPRGEGKSDFLRVHQNCPYIFMNNSKLTIS